MTLEQKIGAMLVFGWNGVSREEQTTLNAHARELVEEMQIGGVILMGRNVADDLAVTVETLNEMQALSREPLLVMTDQEGGPVARFTDGVTVFPSNMALGATGDPGLAYKAAAATARELGAIGVNCDLAPCADVNNNPENPVIGIRSYGESSEKCAEMTAQAVKGYQDNAMIACAKHFPGHGDTAVDSHLALPSIPYPRERLDEVELKPFRAAIGAGVSMIMTTHIMFPALDSARPATLSHRIITGLLREELGFDGVVITDCMEMKAVAENFGTSEAAVIAIEAGADLVLACHTKSTQLEIREAIIKAVKNGRISEDRLDESVARITALKQRYGLESRRSANPAVLSSVLRHPDHLALEREIAERSVTLVRNDDGLIPLKVESKQNVLVLGLHRSVGALGREIGRLHANSGSLRIEGGDPEDAIETALAAASRADVVVVPTSSLEPWREPVDQDLQARIVTSIAELGKKLIVVAVREPYDLRRFPKAKTYIVTCNCSGESLEAAASVIFGRLEPRGTPPVTIPGGAR